MARPTAAIIGAEISVLTTTRTLGDDAIPRPCTALSDRVGRNWACGSPNGLNSANRRLHADTPKHRLSFRQCRSTIRLSAGYGHFA